MPPASMPRTSLTRMRMPRIVGLPKQMVGSTVTRGKISARMVEEYPMSAPGAMRAPYIEYREVPLHQWKGGAIASRSLVEGQGLVARQVVIHRAELGLDQRRALEVMADRHFLGHAHAAVELDGVLADEAAGAADLDLGRRDRLGPVMRDLGKLDVSHVGHRHRLLELHEHIDHAVLEHLEGSDGGAELLALPGVFDGASVKTTQDSACLLYTSDA